MDFDFFSPSASPNLPGDDPLRGWLEQLRGDPELPGLMATDPQAAIKRMQDMGIPPPPVQNFAGDMPFMAGAEATAPLRPQPEPYRMQGNPEEYAAAVGRRSPVPLPQADPRKQLPGEAFDPEASTPQPTKSTLEQEQAGNTDVSARKKSDLAGGLADFGKSLQGVKPVAPPAPNFVGTPSVRSPTPIPGAQLSSLLQLVGQSPHGPGLTLGRLLATGKA